MQTCSRLRARLGAAQSRSRPPAPRPCTSKINQTFEHAQKCTSLLLAVCHSYGILTPLLVTASHLDGTAGVGAGAAGANSGASFNSHRIEGLKKPTRGSVLVVVPCSCCTLRATNTETIAAAPNSAPTTAAGMRGQRWR